MSMTRGDPRDPFPFLPTIMAQTERNTLGDDRGLGDSGFHGGVNAVVDDDDEYDRTDHDADCIDCCR